MLYFQKLAKEVAAEDKTVRAAQIERLTAAGKLPEASNVFYKTCTSVLRDVGLTNFKLMDRGQRKGRNDLVHRCEFSVEGEIDKKRILNALVDFFGRKVQVYFTTEGSVIRFFFAIPGEAL